MEASKSLEDLDTTLEKQKENRAKEYNKRKWLFVLFPWGSGTSADLINKDRKFWMIYAIIILLLGFFLLLVRVIFF